jgi:hypothetical protein
VPGTVSRRPPPKLKQRSDNRPGHALPLGGSGNDVALKVGSAAVGPIPRPTIMTVDGGKGEASPSSFARNPRSPEAVPGRNEPPPPFAGTAQLDPAYKQQGRVKAPGRQPDTFAGEDLAWMAEVSLSSLFRGTRAALEPLRSI